METPAHQCPGATAVPLAARSAEPPPPHPTLDATHARNRCSPWCGRFVVRTQLGTSRRPQAHSDGGFGQTGALHGE
jgi:hypothetical protein